MRAVLYLLAAVAAAAYHLARGSLFLGVALIICVSLYPLARWYAGKAMRWDGDDRDSRLPDD